MRSWVFRHRRELEALYGRARAAHASRAPHPETALVSRGGVGEDGLVLVELAPVPRRSSPASTG